MRPTQPIAYTSGNTVLYNPDSLFHAKEIQYMVGHILDSINAVELEKLNADKHARELGLQIVEVAKEFLGCRYGSGQMGPKRFDCSGLTSFVYKQFGVSLNRSSSDQFFNGTLIEDRKTLRPGDLVYFNGHKVGDRIGHVGIVVDADENTGEFHFIHAAITGGVMINHSTEPYYKIRYKGARRIFI